MEGLKEMKEKAKEVLSSTMERASEAMAPDRNVMTSNFGQPLGDVTHSLNINGYVLAADVALMEKQQTFNRSKIVERMVHPCGSGAFGYFEVTKDMTRYCKAKFLDTPGKRTPIFIRFSTVTYGKEFPDAGRNPRGFAIKFYTEEGNYDLVGLNFPIFFVRDPALGPDVIRSQMRKPDSFLLNFDSIFDFMSLVPEALHCGTMFFSDHGTPRGWIHMHGYGCHTFKWVNADGEQFYVKYHFRCENGVQNFTYDEHVRMSGEDPDYSKRELWELLEGGGQATWTACVQIMPAAEARQYRWDPFDVTKVWPHADYPLMEFGRLVVNKNPENYHRDVEQAAFNPGSYVPGIEPSPDPLLQFRSFFYRDTQYYRLGVNMHQIPVNCPYMAGRLHPMARDGAMRADHNGGDNRSEPHYMPNSASGPKPDKRYDWAPVQVSGTIERKGASKHESSPDDDYVQVRELYLRVMSETDRQHLHLNIAKWLKFVRPEIQRNMLVQLYKIHPSYAEGVARMTQAEGGLKVQLDEVATTAKSTETLVDRSNVYQLAGAAH